MLRPRLLAALRRRWDLRIVGVVAGAGFGKTTLLAHAVEQNGLDPLGEDVYHRCRPEDGDASVLSATLGRLLGDARTHAAAVEALASAIAEACTDRSPRPISIILDDVHVLDPGGSAVALIRRLLTDLPSNAHLVLASRHALPVPLAQLVVRGEAVVLEEADLAFDPDELRDFARLRNTPPDQLTGAANWPALAELSAGASGASVHDFLWQEVLDQLAVDRRRDLALVAAVGGGDRAVMEAAVDHELDVDALLRDVPLVARSANGELTLHALWNDPLAGLISEEDRAAALVRVGLLCSTRRELQRAFQLLSAAHAWPQIGALIVRACTPLVAPPADVLLRWHERLPRRLQEAAEGQLVHALARKQRELDPQQAVEPLVRAGAAFRARGETRGEFACLNHLVQIAYWCGLDGLAEACVVRAADLEPDVRGARAITALGPAVVASARGDSATVLRAIAAGGREFVSDANRHVTDQLEAEALIAVGRPAAAVARATDLPPLAAADTLTAARWAAGRIDEALALIEDADVVARDASIRQRQAITAQAARLLAFVGRSDEASKLIATCTALGPPGTTVLRIRLVLAEAALAVATGDEPRAVHALERILTDLPLTSARNARSFLRAPGLLYVLVPETRELIDDLLAAWGSDPASEPATTSTAGCLRALVDARERGDLASMQKVAWPAVDVIRSLLPVPWVAELAAASFEAGHGPGQELAGALGRAARAELRRVVSEGGPLAPAARGALVGLDLPPPFDLEIKVMGPLAVLRDGVAVDVPELRRDRVRQLLGLLVTQRKVSRDHVMAALWPDLEREPAANNLRVTLSYLTGALEPDRSRGEAAFFIRQGPIWLELVGSDSLTIDLDAFEAERARGERYERDGVPSLALDAYRTASELWHGAYLEDVTAEWAALEQLRVRTAWINVALRAGELALASGALDEAVRAGSRVLAHEPWSERAYALLLAVHLERGDQTAAARTARRCQAVLDELGVPAAPGTQMLLRRLRAS